MAVSKWSKKLAGMKSAWKASEDTYKETFGAADIPEDTYVAQLQEAMLDEDKKQNVVIRREHIITEGAHKGVVVRDRMNLSNDMGQVFVRRWLQMLGVDIPEDISELETLVSEIKKAAPVCKVRIRHSGDFTNVDVISVEDGADATVEAASGDSGVDLDTLDKDGLRKLVVDNDLEIPGYRKMSEDELRAAITEKIGGDSAPAEIPAADDSADAGIDLDAMDKAEMLKLIADNELKPADLDFANELKMKGAKEDALRAALTKYLSDSADAPSGAEAVDETLQAARIFCGTWDVAIEADADLDDIKTALKKCRFPSKELDETEKALLVTIEMTECIQEEQAAKKKLLIKK